MKRVYRHLTTAAKRLFRNNTNLALLNLLHILNDGAKTGMLILLPFIAKDLHINLTQVGMLGTILNICSFLFALPAGYISAKVGGLKAVIFALCLYGIGFLTSGFVPSVDGSFLFLIFTFFIAGMGFGLFHPIGLALIARWSDKATRGREMGNFTALGDIGTVGVPAVFTFFIVLVGWRLVSMSFAVIALIIFFILYVFYLSKTERGEDRIKQQQNISFKTLLKNRQLLIAITASALDTFTSSPLFVFLPFLLLKKGIPPVWLGVVSALFFIGSFAGKSIFGRAADKFGNVRTFVISEIGMAVFILILVTAQPLPIILVTCVIIGIFTKGTVPVIPTMISDAVEHEGVLEKALGLNGFFTGIASTLAPLVLGFISDKFTINAAFTVMAGVAMLAIVPAVLVKLPRVKVL